MSRRSRRQQRTTSKLMRRRFAQKRETPTRRLLLESLEERQLLAVDLELLAGSTMSAGANTPLSSNARQQAEMQIAVNPADPMQIAGVSTSFI